MKQNILSPRNIILALCAPFMALASCTDMMDTGSGRVAYEENHRLDNPNDSIYSVMGVLSLIQQIADRTIIMGELRGELMTVDYDNASTALQDINNFEATADNEYAGARDFYNVINNCNYIIARMDTSITEGRTKVMVPEYAQVKTLRAWTYWQMALIFGKVNYYTQPLTDVNAQPGTNTVDIDALAQLLISDLEPVAGARPLDYGSVDGWNSSEFFFPTKMMLGDLYLYNNEYERAAQAYAELIDQRQLTVNPNYANYWQSTTRQEMNDGHVRAYQNDVVTRLAFNSLLSASHSQMANLTASTRPSLLPAGSFVDWMNKRTHFHTDGQAISRYFIGDLRGNAEYANGRSRADAYGALPAALATTAVPAPAVITKFYNNLSGNETDDMKQRRLNSVALCRPSTVYLRLAEAINKLGRPTMAFAVLKYGLSQQTLRDTLKVDSNEVKNLPSYLQLTSGAYNYNIGTAARGCGLGIKFDRAQYVIPANADTTDYVERAILDELAAETCYEGNRFFDLLRISRHRADHPLLMQKQMAPKYAARPAVLEKLKDISNWFIKQ